MPKKFDPIKVQKLEDETINFNEKLELVAANGYISNFYYNSLVASLNRAENLLKEGRNVFFDLSETVSINIDALAYLLGNIEYFIKVYGKNKINGSYSKSNLVNQILTDSGFFNRLGAKNILGDSNCNQLSQRTLKFISGRYVNAETIIPLRVQVLNDACKLSLQADKKIFRALSEAMLNVHHHAYDGVKYQIGRKKDIKGRWWLGGTFNSNDGILCFAMYDVGDGIPATMPRNYRTYLEKFTPAAETLDDSELVYLATQRGKTSTLQGHRGRGIPDMHQIVKDGHGHMQILSGYGFYSFNGQSGHKFKLPMPCRGTLVVWNIFTNSLND